MKSSYTTEELAGAVGGTLRGDPKVVISGVEDIRRAQSHHACWAGDAHYARLLADSRAGVVLVPASSGPTPMPAILVPHMDRAVGKLLELFTPPWPKPAAGIHPTAIVDPTARIGDNVSIGPYAVIGPHVVLGQNVVLHNGVHLYDHSQVGDDSVLWDYVVVREHCVVGSRVFLHSHVVLGTDGFGYFFDRGAHQKFAHGGIVVVEDDVEIGAGTMIDRAKFGETRIGRGTKIDNLVQIGHNVRIGPCCILVSGALIAGSVEFEAGVVVGGGGGIIEHVRMGKQSRLAAMSCAWGDVPDGVTVSGIPAREHKQNLRVEAIIQRLPEMREMLRDLADRIDKLEAAANHRQPI